MHFRICCATILVIFCTLKDFVMHRHTHNQLSARVDSQIHFSVVAYGRMQDLPRGGNYYLRGLAFAKGVREHASPKKILMVQFGAFWSIFSLFFYFQKVYKYHFYTKIIINCSHVLARGSRSMVHSSLIIFIKGCNL